MLTPEQQEKAVKLAYAKRNGLEKELLETHKEAQVLHNKGVVLNQEIWKVIRLLRTLGEEINHEPYSVRIGRLTEDAKR